MIPRGRPLTNRVQTGFWVLGPLTFLKMTKSLFMMINTYINCLSDAQSAAASVDFTMLEQEQGSGVPVSKEQEVQEWRPRKRRQCLVFWV